MEKTFYPLCARVHVPAGTTPGTPEIVELRPQQDYLGTVVVYISEAAFVSHDGGFRVLNGSEVLFPAPGSVSSDDFNNTAQYGCLPPGLAILELKFNKKLKARLSLRFEFYNSSVADFHVGIIAHCYNEQAQKDTQQLREDK